MASRSKFQLWDPRSGIRFSPKQKPRSSPIAADIRSFPLPRYSSNIANNVPTQSGQTNVSTKDVALPESVSVTATEPDVPDSRPESTPDVAEASWNDTKVPDGQIDDVTPIDQFPPSTSLHYRMSPETFQRVKKSAPGSSQSFWSHRLYQSIGEDGLARNVKVHYCTSKHTMEHVCKSYFIGEKVVGFDLEWSPWSTLSSGPRKNVALIQISSESRIALFHCSSFTKDDFVAPTFRQIMGDPSVKKVGVAIKADCTRLKKFLGVDTLGIYELSHLYKVVRYSRERRPSLVNKSLVSLAALVEGCLGLPLYKGDSIRSSDWTKTLNEQQILYSASDAYAGVQLYHALEEQRRSLVPTPPHPHAAELGLPLQLAISQEDDEATESEVSESTPEDADPSRKVKSSSRPSLQAKDDRVIAADLKMQTYRSSKKTAILAAPSQLRAYYVWYSNEDLGPESVAKLLRDPPLQTNTVISYILNAVVAERLPYDKCRMKDEVLSLLQPNALAASKYTDLVTTCMASAPPAT